MASKGTKIDKRIEAAFYANCRNMPIPMMKIGAVFETGRAAIAKGADDEALGKTLKEFCEGIMVKESA